MKKLILILGIISLNFSYAKDWCESDWAQDEIEVMRNHPTNRAFKFVEIECKDSTYIENFWFIFELSDYELNVFKKSIKQQHQAIICEAMRHYNVPKNHPSANLNHYRTYYSVDGKFLFESFANPQECYR